MTAANRDDAMRDVAREVLDELLRGLVGGGSGDVRVNGHAGDASPRRSRTTDALDDAPIVPAVPAPPVASVLRPSTWTDPPAPGEVIGEGTPADHGGTPRILRATAGASEDRVEPVTIDSDEDLQRFVVALATRLADPRDRMAIGDGRLRFTLRRGSSVTGAGAATTASRTATTAPGARTRAATTAPGARTRAAGAARAGTDAGGAEVATRLIQGVATERTVRDAAAEGARLVLAPGAVLTPLARDRSKALGIEIEWEPRC